VKTKSKKTDLRFKFTTLVTMSLLILVSALQARAQQITGSIVGTVKDEQGAVVPGASVKATNADTGFSRVATTAGDGAYRIEYLPIGKYDVNVEMAGFKKFVQQNVVLAVDQAQALNVTLAVGASSETVTVSAAPPLVETTTATLGRTVQPAEIIGLPLVNRNAYAELSLTPGVQSNSASGATNSSNSNPNGTPNYQIGVPSTQVVVNPSDPGYAPPPPRTTVRSDDEVGGVTTGPSGRSAVAIIATDALYGGVGGALIGAGITLIDQGNNWARNLMLATGIGVLAGAGYGVYEAATQPPPRRAVADRNPAASDTGFSLTATSGQF